MDKAHNSSNPSKVNDGCVYEGKFQKSFFIYEVKCTVLEYICIGKKQQTFKKRMDVHFSNAKVFFKLDKI